MHGSPLGNGSGSGSGQAGAVLLITMHIPRPHARPPDLAVEFDFLHIDQYPQVILRPIHISEPLFERL